MIEGFELLAEGHLAGDLTADETRAFTAHLAICADCRARFEAHRAAADRLALLTTAPLAPMAPNFTDKVMRKLPPGAPPPAAPAASAAPFVVLAVGVAALIAGGAAVWFAGTRPAPQPSMRASAAPAPASVSAPVTPAPLPSVARPGASVNGLGDDAGGGATER